MVTTFPSLEHPVMGSGSATINQLGALGAALLLIGERTEGRLSLVDHPCAPRGLAAPMHRHANEDEYSFVIEGEWGFEQGGAVVYARPGDLVAKPRNTWHTFWNATDRPARILEIITPAGFEHYFEEIAPLLATDGPPDEARVANLLDRYGLEVDWASVPALCERYGVRFG